MRTARIARHMVANIDGTLSALRRGEDMALAMLDISDFQEAIKEVEKMKADGWEVIPSDSCDNYDYAGNCLGHKTWKEES